MYKFLYLLILIVFESNYLYNARKLGNLKQFNRGKCNRYRSSANFSGFMIHGKNAKKLQFPYIVSLTGKDKDTHFCGGALISESYVISAAHCFCSPKIYNTPRKVYLRAGIVQVNVHDLGQTRDVEDMHCHPGFNTSIMHYYDIGMLKAKKPFKINNRVAPIALWTGDYHRFQRKEGMLPVVISGWGANKYEGKGNVNLEFINTYCIGAAACKKMLMKVDPKAMVYAQDFNLCTYNADDSRTCSGDSGGPVVYKNALLGIVSGSIKCDKGVPGFHSNVPFYYDWIHTIGKDNIKTKKLSRLRRLNTN